MKNLFEPMLEELKKEYPVIFAMVKEIIKQNEELKKENEKLKANYDI